jgi:hypothetical protein
LVAASEVAERIVLDGRPLMYLISGGGSQLGLNTGSALANARSVGTVSVELGARTDGIDD